MDTVTGSSGTDSEFDGATKASTSRFPEPMRISHSSVPSMRSEVRDDHHAPSSRQMGIDESTHSPATSSRSWSIPGLSMNGHRVTEPTLVPKLAAAADVIHMNPGDARTLQSASADASTSFVESSFTEYSGNATTDCCDTAAKEMSANTRGFTACCDGKPVVCVIEANLERPPVSNILDPNIKAGEPPPAGVKSKLDACARAHEQAHIDSGDVGDCAGRDGVPTGFDPAMSAEDRALAEFAHNVDEAECIKDLDCAEDPECVAWRDGLAKDKHIVADEYFYKYMNALAKRLGW